MSAHLDIYCEKCRDNRTDPDWWRNCETKCGNKTKFIQQQTDPNKKINLDKYWDEPFKYWKSDQDRNDVLDPHNCQAS